MQEVRGSSPLPPTTTPSPRRSRIWSHAVALRFMYYNYCRIHRLLRVTPAMAAGVTGRFWSVEDIVRLLEERERVALQEARCFT